MKETEEVRGCCSPQMGYHKEGERSGGAEEADPQQEQTHHVLPTAQPQDSLRVFKHMIHILNALDPGSSPTPQDKRLIGVFFVRPHGNRAAHSNKT